MSELLRQYERWECGGDGYPDAWHRGIVYIATGPHLLPREVTNHPRQHSIGIKDIIRDQAGHRCLRCGHPYEQGMGKWSPCDERCNHEGPLRVIEREEGYPDRVYHCPRWQHISSLRAGGLSRIATVEAQWRILTVHHLDEDKANCRWWNLAALCQRCHLRMQRAVIMDRPWHYEHSAWFKPFAAGFYAWKYLQEDLTREQTMERLDELLALEHRFTQEAIF